MKSAERRVDMNIWRLPTHTHTICVGLGTGLGLVLARVGSIQQSSVDYRNEDLLEDNGTDLD